MKRKSYEEFIEEEKIRIENLPYTVPKNLAQILDGFKYAVNQKNTSAVLIVDGRSGMGKTTLAGQCGLYCDANFNIDNYYWEPESFLKGLEEAQPGSFHIFDEAMLISSRTAMSSINIMIIQAMSMIRSKRLIVCFCVNSIFDLDRNIALSRADILLHVYGASLTKRGDFMAFFKGADKKDRLKELYIKGKKYYNYEVVRSNFFTSFPSCFVVDEVEYERRKQEGVNKFLSGSKGSKAMRFQYQRNLLIAWIRKNCKVTIEEMADIIKADSRTVDRIISYLKQIGMIENEAPRLISDD